MFSRLRLATRYFESLVVIATWYTSGGGQCEEGCWYALLPVRSRSIRTTGTVVCTPCRRRNPNEYGEKIIPSYESTLPNPLASYDSLTPAVEERTGMPSRR